MQLANKRKQALDQLSKEKQDLVSKQKQQMDEQEQKHVAGVCLGENLCAFISIVINAKLHFLIFSFLCVCVCVCVCVFSPSSVMVLHRLLR